MLLEKDTRVDLELLGSARVVGVLGSGGQGHVYEVERDGAPLALKWYREQCATEAQWAALHMLVDQGAPHARFLWPLSLATVPGHSGFGYVMPVRDDRFVEMGHLLGRRTSNGQLLQVSFSSVINLCRQTADSFLRLHSRGLCYRDISFGNVFFDPSTGDVLICDNDNVGVDNGQARVLGTPFFMAPEIVRDVTFQTMPSTQTDLHSLAVLLFYALFIAHPLEGRRTEAGLRDEAWLLTHFGREPLFTFDPHDESNRPVDPHVETYWRAYPQFLRQYFIQAFTVGLTDPWSRVTESEWIKAMRRLRDSMVQCPIRHTNFVDPAVGSSQQCVRCERTVTSAYTLKLGRHRLPVSPFTEIRSDHVAAAGEPSRLGRVRRHPGDPGRWGLHNLTRKTWEATLSDGQRFAVEPDRTVDLRTGMRIDLRPGIVHVLK